MEKRYDCVIVGGSITGLTAARELSKKASVLLVESNPAIGTPFRCSGFINAPAFEEFALDKSQIQNSISRLEVVHGGSRLTFASKKPSGFVTERPALERSLLGEIEPYTDIVAGDRVVDIKGATVSLHTSGNVSAGCLIGADGTNSLVRRSIGIADPEKVTAVQFELPGSFESDCATIYVGEEFMPFHLWVIPVNESLARIGVGASGDVKAGMQRLLELVKKYKIADYPRYSESRFMVNTLPASPVSSTGTGSTMLAGMSGGIIKPLSLGGIYFGMLSSSMAARSLIDGTLASGYRRKLENAGILRRVSDEFALLKRWSSLTDAELGNAFGSAKMGYGSEIPMPSGETSQTSGITGVIKFLIANSAAGG
ncbi:MAG: NAD(P)/FAD-dependent oxidoreductase [Candidatus Micrarchaeales archaeon]|jgi:FAD binding domain.|uniref:Geranylgeranyl reductase n=1 Tax=Candidatus Micrarchaeum acidiphilum ARMAN-2 TaxID=425595 RepID=C7DGR0_MICA2|nr:MAG: geranylgeranyl reductase [Candidatus Micrarchaeum acidiphilum ARMAN-2]MCW6161541.1 NAD(P)/FAD-dependent oxidoreductase [Candidatus Micrarchaeales archaeon]